MGKESRINPKEVLEAAVEEVLFIPSPAQKRVKAKLLARLEDNPVNELEHITCAAAVSITKDSKLHNYWSIPGFKEWFRDEDEFKINLNVAAQNALNVLNEICANPANPPSSRVSAAKIIIEQKSKIEPKIAAKFLDEKLENMSPEQLEHTIQKLVDKGKS
jgi:hypothetical protein